MAEEIHYLTPAEAALRTRFSLKTIYRAIHSGELAASRPTGTRYRIAMSDLAQWASRGRVTAEGVAAVGIPYPSAPAEVGSLRRLKAMENHAA
jgi:excisionase family DNA binding protein